jgi:hypothetical protein
MFKILKWLIYIAIIVGAFMLGAKLFSKEDTWICQDGKWVKHGNPSAEKPTEPCK